ncbi:FMN-binding protein [Luteimicrobium sp. NPDC057192]|uniref:FMN-binding protein n=1 Tax=Luteimicrobium sp. NPDC057192 TaxID=3346042 RepID=UPI00362B512C
MKRIVLWSLSTLTVLVLLLSYHTSTSSRVPLGSESSVVAQAGTAGSGSSGSSGSSGAAGSDSSGSGSSDSSGSDSSGSGSGSSGSSGSSSSASKTVDGDTAQTQWGPVQVSVTVAGGNVTEVTVLQQPNGNGRDQQINSYALPILRQEALSAQSANIDMVSGATVTSQGYVSSLQSALDKAGI